MQEKSDTAKERTSRREFLASNGVLAAGMYLAGPTTAGAVETLAIRGGKKAITAPAGDSTAWPRFGEEETDAVNAVVRSFNYSENAALEKDWQEHFKPPFCKSHMNGTSALTSALFALDLPVGSEILVPSLDPWFGILPMRLFGLVPIFVDNNPRTLNFDVEDAERRLTKNTRAIEVVHLFGMPCDMEAICDFAKRKGLLILEDCCHAHNASINGKYVGNWGQIGAFSFQGSKILPAMEGGIANYENREYYERAATFGHYECPPQFPSDSKYKKYATGLGLKLRIHPLGAALARCQLRGLEQQTEMERRQNHELNSRLCQLPGLSQPPLAPGVKRVYWRWNNLFIDSAKAGMSRDVAIKALKAEGVKVGRLNYKTSHRDTVYNEPGWWHHPPVIPDRLPGQEEALQSGISLPRFTKPVPELVDQYVRAFEKVWAHRAELAKT